MRILAFGALALTLAACGSEKGGSSDTPTTTGTTGGTTGGTASGTTTGGTTECMGALGVTWFWSDDGGDPPGSCGDSLTIDICDPLGENAWSLGMAETANMSSGWFGEDCLGGAYGYDVCHSIAAYDTIIEAPNCALGDVTDGVTLFDASKDPGDGSIFITYYIEDSLGYCFTWGDDPSYYTAVGCESLMTM